MRKSEQLPLWMVDMIYKKTKIQSDDFPTRHKYFFSLLWVSWFLQRKSSDTNYYIKK